MRRLLGSFLLLGACGAPAAEPISTGQTVAEAHAQTETYPVPHAEHEGRASTCAPVFTSVATPGARFDDVAIADVLAWPVAGASFTVTTSRAGDAAIIEGTLRNDTDAEVSVDYLTGGVMGLSTNPFIVAIDGEVATAEGAAMPEVFPSPRRVVLPAHGSVRFHVERCQGFPAVAHWTFSPWTGGPVRGEVTVR